MAKKITIKYLSLEEFQKIMKEEDNKEFRLAYALGFGSGLRISEIIGYYKKNGDIIVPPLTIDNVDLKNHQIKIVSGKGNKDRITVTSPYLNEERLKLLPLKIPRRTLQGKFSRLSKRVIGKQLSFHTLRHGFANYMINEKDMPLPMVQGMLGHSRLDTTGIYAKANPKQATDRAFDMWVK